MILPRMVKGDDVWITVLILVVRLLTLLSSELIQAGGSSVERKRFSEFLFRKTFFLGWVGEGCVPLCVGRGGGERRSLLQANSYLSFVLGIAIR